MKFLVRCGRDLWDIGVYADSEEDAIRIAIESVNPENLGTFCGVKQIAFWKSERAHKTKWWLTDRFVEFDEAAGK